MYFYKKESNHNAQYTFIPAIRNRQLDYKHVENEYNQAALLTMTQKSGGVNRSPDLC